jgi:aerobic carbon-monoxide dehydrogenase medium subunit
MKPASFDYARPNSVQAALKILAERSAGAKIIAGGQSLVPMMNFRLARPECLIDINRIGELDFHKVEGGELIIGALARHATLFASNVVRGACPLMAEAYQYVSHGPIRNRGTLCGNLCHADPASEMPAVMLAVDAQLVLRSARSVRRVVGRDFFRGIYQTAIEPDELLMEVRIPVVPSGQGWGFQEMSIRKGDFALAGVATTLSVAKGRIAAAAISICGVGDRAQRLPSAEAMLIGHAPDTGTFRKAGDAAAAAVEPQSDVNADKEYRRDLVRTLVTRALADAGSTVS